MKMISWNVRGLGSREKRAAVKDVIRKFRAKIVLIQESKLSVVSDSLVKDVWEVRLQNGCVVSQQELQGGFW